MLSNFHHWNPLIWNYQLQIISNGTLHITWRNQCYELLLNTLYFTQFSNNLSCVCEHILCIHLVMNTTTKWMSYSYYLLFSSNTNIWDFLHNISKGFYMILQTGWIIIIIFLLLDHTHTYVHLSFTFLQL